MVAASSRVTCLLVAATGNCVENRLGELMRVQQATSVILLTEPFDDIPSSVTATATSERTGAALTAPTTTVSGNRVKVTLTVANHTTNLDNLVITVNATVDSLTEKQVMEVQVVGSHYCTLASLRAEAKLDDVSRFPDWLLAEVRDEVTSYVEEAANVAFVPSFASESHIGDDSNNLVLRTNQARSIVAISVDGVAQSLTNFELLAGDQLHGKSGFPFLNREPVVVKLEHGHDRPPTRLVREIKKAIRSELLSRGAQAPRDLLWEQTADGNTVRYSTPDWAAGRYTGTMSLDTAIHAYGSVLIGFA